MANANYATEGAAGSNFSRRTTEAEFDLGTTQTGNENTLWIYGQASGSVATGTCTVDDVTFLITDAAGDYTADTAFADTEYGWVRQTAGRT